jgi:hypothetical protein
VTSEMPSAIDILTSDLYSKHLQDFSFSEAMSALTTTVTYVVSMLKHHFPGIPTLIERLNGIHQSVSRGNIASVRRVELELLHAAKVRRRASHYPWMTNFILRTDDITLL